jgi:dual-specificity kinase
VCHPNPKCLLDLHALTSFQDIIPPVTDFNRQFLDLLQRIFVYDPKKRLTAKEALKHPWFKESIQDDGTEATRIKNDRERRALEKQRARYS